MLYSCVNFKKFSKWGLKWNWCFSLSKISREDLSLNHHRKNTVLFKLVKVSLLILFLYTQIEYFLICITEFNYYIYNMFTGASTTSHKGYKKLAKANRGKALRKPFNTGYKEIWLKKLHLIASLPVQMDTAYLLHDVAANRFIFFSDKAKILGNYKTEDLTSEKGMDDFMSNIHPEQRNAVTTMQHKIIDYCVDYPYTCENNVVANITFLYKKKGGGFFQILQKAIVVETDTEGRPLLFLLFLSDISHLMKPSAGLIINNSDGSTAWIYNIHNKHLEEIDLLSAQEKKILGLLAQGKHSKEIADMLFISSHTIDTHRRNILKKTHCIDTTALITFAKMTGIL